MCGRFTLRTSVFVIAEQFGLLECPSFAARFNIASSQPVLAIRRDCQGHREPAWLRWGLVPAWSEPTAAGLINARAETAAERPAFRDAFRRRRCLVVADGFYEWRRAGRAKQPYFLHFGDDRPFAFAGLWEASSETCAILTVEPNELVRPIHDRMPAILAASSYDAWLDPAMDDPRRLAPLLTPYPSDAMEARAVGAWVNDPAHESPRCLEPDVPLLRETGAAD